MPHNDGQHGEPDAPKGFVAHDGQGIAHKAAENPLAWPEDAARPEGQTLAAQGVGQRYRKLHYAGGQRRRRRAGDAQGGRAKFTENQDIVQECVGTHGDGKEHCAERRVLRTAVYSGVNTADAIENVGEPHDLDIGQPQVDQVLIGGDEPQDLGGEQEHDQSHAGGKAGDGVQGHAQTAVDVVGVPPPPILADQHGHTALEAKDDDLHNKDGYVGRRHGGHLRIAQQPNHECVGKAERRGNQVLQNHRQSQGEQMTVKAGFPAQRF